MTKFKNTFYSIFENTNREEISKFKLESIIDYNNKKDRSERDPNTSKYVDLAINNDDTYTRTKAAESKLLEPHHIEVLKYDPDEGVRQSLASNRSVSTSLLHDMVNDSSLPVRQSLAKRPIKESEITHKLIDDPHPSIAAYVAFNNYYLNKDHVDKIVRKVDNPEAIRNIVFNDDITGKGFDLSSLDLKTGEYKQRTPAITTEHIDSMVNHFKDIEPNNHMSRSVDILHGAAKHPMLSNQSMKILLTHPAAHVRTAVVSRNDFAERFKGIFND